MSELIGAVTLGLMAIAGLVASGYILYGLVMTVLGVARGLTEDLHLPQIHHTGGLAPHQ